MSTAHLGSLGARNIVRREFVDALRRWTAEGPDVGEWPHNGAHALVHDLALDHDLFARNV